MSPVPYPSTPSTPRRIRGSYGSTVEPPTSSSACRPTPSRSTRKTRSMAKPPRGTKFPSNGKACHGRTRQRSVKNHARQPFIETAAATDLTRRLQVPTPPPSPMKVDGVSTMPKKGMMEQYLAGRDSARSSSPPLQWTSPAKDTGFRTGVAQFSTSEVALFPKIGDFDNPVTPRSQCRSLRFGADVGRTIYSPQKRIEGTVLSDGWDTWSPRGTIARLNNGIQDPEGSEAHSKVGLNAARERLLE